MTDTARGFYRRYTLFTQLLPPYIIAAVLYTTAYLMAPRSGFDKGSIGEIAFFAGFLFFLLFRHRVSGLAFHLSPVPRMRVEPAFDEKTKLDDALAPMGNFPAPLVPALVDLGEVPFLAIGGYHPDQVWISTHTLRRTEPGDLRCLIAHEFGHLAAGHGLVRSVGYGPPWYDLTWLLAYPAAMLLAGAPLWIPLVAAVHVGLWLRLQDHLRGQVEKGADKWAAGQMGRLEYAAAMARHLAQFERSGSQDLRRRRLEALGLEPGEVLRLVSESGRDDRG